MELSRRTRSARGEASSFDFDGHHSATGAFTRALREKQDVRALFNHDPNRVLGRVPKTLKLREDSVGLAVEIEPPSSERGLLELMERGDVS